MFYSFSIIPFTIIIYYILICTSNAIPLEEDKMLIAFMKGHQEKQIGEYSKQKYEAHLGIIYYMRNNWKCDKIAENFVEYERTECQKYRKYLDILYEYLFREYAGIPTVKPKFVFKKEIEIEGPIIYAVNCLVRISQFYLNAEESEYYEYKLNKLFYKHFEPKLLNENRLNYGIKLENEAKLPINEMILQLAIDTANEWQTNENLYGIIRPNFEKNLEEMFKKADEEKIEKEESRGRTITIYYNDKHCLIAQSEFDDQWDWTTDVLFSEFVKGLTKNSENFSNLEKFLEMLKEYSALSRNKINENVHNSSNRRTIIFEFDKTEKMKEHLQQKYEAHLGLVYLMRKNWQCEKMKKKIKEKCQKYRKYLHLFYESLFRLYVEGKNTELANEFSVVKPIFMCDFGFTVDFISVIEKLNEISEICEKDNKRLKDVFPYDMDLLNEFEVNYEINSKIKQNILEKNNGRKKVQKKGKKILNLSNIIEDYLRQEFQQKMEEMYKNTKEKAKKEEAKLEKAIENAQNYVETNNLQREYDDKFDAFISSPFS